MLSKASQVPRPCLLATRIELGIKNDVGFIGYVGSPDFHHGVVLRVSIEGKKAEVVVQGPSGRKHVVLFEGVDEVETAETMRASEKKEESSNWRVN